MATYRLKAGCKHGQRDEYGPGSILELTEAEVLAFGDKFELVTEASNQASSKEQASTPADQPAPVIPGTEPFPVTDTAFSFSGPEGLKVTQVDVDGARVEVPQIEQAEAFDVDGAKVSEVVDAVRAGKITAQEALTTEQAGKNRKSLVEALEELSREQGK